MNFISKSPYVKYISLDIISYFIYIYRISSVGCFIRRRLENIKQKCPWRVFLFLILMYFLYLIYQVLQNLLDNLFSIQDTELSDEMKPWLLWGLRWSKLNISIPIPYIGFVISEDAIDYSWYPLLFIIYPDLQIILPIRNGIHPDMFMEILFDGCLDHIDSLLQFIFKFSDEFHPWFDRIFLRLFQSEGFWNIVFHIFRLIIH